MNALLEKFGWEVLGFILLSPFLAFAYDALGRSGAFGAGLAVAFLCYGILRRLEGKARRLLLAPLSLSVIAILFQLRSLNTGSRLYIENSGKLFGVPLFLGICMMAAPSLADVSGNVFKYASLVLLLTGILPGDGYIYFVAVLPVLLFVALIIALPIDLIALESGRDPLNANRPPAPPISTAPHPHPAA